MFGIAIIDQKNGVRLRMKIEPSKKMLKRFELAEALAINNDSKFRHFALLVAKGTIINTSHNSKRPCSFGTRFRNPDKGQATLHSELGAILNVSRQNTEGSDVYVVRVNANGERRSSKPCQMCVEAMRFCGIRRVYYSVEDGYEMLRL